MNNSEGLNKSGLGARAAIVLLLAACAGDDSAVKSENAPSGTPPSEPSEPGAPADTNEPPRQGPPSGTALSVFVTLGTNGGPVADIARSQPANALQVGDSLYLVDAGDAAASQLARAGLSLRQLKGIFLSHLHFDHTAGVLGVLGARLQTDVTDKLTIYGPPGTKHFIDGLMSSIAPTMRVAYGMPGQEWQGEVEAKELVNESVVKLDGLTVVVAENSHFAIPDSATPELAKSLAFRFDMQDRSIAFTGDTGPSLNVESLAKGADLLVSEVIDVPATLADVVRTAPNIPPDALAGLEWHFRAHHITPVQVGELAAAAGVGAVLLTHVAPPISTEEARRAVVEAVNSAYGGGVIVAADLDRY